MRRAFASLLLILLALPAGSASLTGRVFRVADGDTVTIQTTTGTERIRLAGIDAPELDQPYGKVSGASLASVVAGKEVRVEFDKRDRYGRIVGEVWVRSPDTRCGAKSCPKTLDTSLYQLTVGMAWWYRRYAHEQTPEDRGQYEFAEFEAKAKGAGLWAAKDPIPPWEWRQGKRGVQAASDVATAAIVGNRRSGIYHEPGCPDYAKVSERNRVLFGTAAEAEDAGYRRAGNC